MTTVPNSTNIEFQYGMRFASTTNPLTATVQNATNMTLNITYSPNEESKIPHSTTVMFAVPTGNTNYYYAYGYIGLGSGLGTFTVGIQLSGLVRIA